MRAVIVIATATVGMTAEAATATIQDHHHDTVVVMTDLQTLTAIAMSAHLSVVVMSALLTIATRQSMNIFIMSMAVSRFT